MTHDTSSHGVTYEPFGRAVAVVGPKQFSIGHTALEDVVEATLLPGAASGPVECGVCGNHRGHVLDCRDVTERPRRAIACNEDERDDGERRAHGRRKGCSKDGFACNELPRLSCGRVTALLYVRSVTTPEPERRPLSSWLAAGAHLHVTRFRVLVTPRRPGRLRNPVSAVVRGLLGERLRALQCVTRASVCDGCPETLHCGYHQLFERVHDAMETRAFWLQGIPFDELLDARPFEATLCTWGMSNPMLTALDLAFRDALVQVGDRNRPPNRITVTKVDTVGWGSVASPVQQVTLVARSPLALRGDREGAATLCPAEPSFGLLLRAGVRRIAALLRASGVQPARVAWPDLSKVHRVGAPWRWWSSSRYSHRHERRQPLEGYTGSLSLTGDGLQEVLPLLCALELTNVGRHTTYGLGELALVS